MTADAQSALRRVMETYSKVTRFCLICNYVSRIIEPLTSRCAKFRFKPLDGGVMRQRLEDICQSEGVLGARVPAVLDCVMQVSNGDLRKAITYLQSTHTFYGADLDVPHIVQIAGIIPDVQGDQRCRCSPLFVCLITTRSAGVRGRHAVQLVRHTGARGAGGAMGRALGASDVGAAACAAPERSLHIRLAKERHPAQDGRGGQIPHRWLRRIPTAPGGGVGGHACFVRMKKKPACTMKARVAAINYDKAVELLQAGDLVGARRAADRAHEFGALATL